MFCLPHFLIINYFIIQLKDFRFQSKREQIENQ